jgi:hypothetical protein
MIGRGRTIGIPFGIATSKLAGREGAIRAPDIPEV